MGELEKLREHYPELLLEVRGKGLLIGLDFASQELGYQVAAGLFRRRVLVAGTLLDSKTIRIEPALNIARDVVDRVLAALGETLHEIADEPETEAEAPAVSNNELERPAL
jgi:putrescine aminotransferase